VSTTRLHNIAGKYTGKDDPVMLVRVQGPFPATGEALAPFNIGHYVAGFMRGSHTGPLMPVKMNSSVRILMVHLLSVPSVFVSMKVDLQNLRMPLTTHTGTI
jgi:fructose 1,6-bisphosphatase